MMPNLLSIVALFFTAPEIISIIQNHTHVLEIKVDPTLVPDGQNFTRFIISPAAPVIDLSAPADPHGESSANSTVTVGPCHVLAGYRLYPLIIRSARDPNAKPITLRITYQNYPRITLPPSLAAVYRGLILNYQYDPNALPAGLLIITPNSFVSAIQPLADWKEKKGWTVTVATLSQTGSTAAAIKNYITSAYQNWSPRPEYVILVGDRDSLPTFTLYSNPTDHPYSTVDGADFFSDLLIGRLSVANVNDLNTVVAKITGYEKNPYLADTTWFKRGLMVGANYPSNMTTPLPVKRMIRQRLLSDGFMAVDTVYYPPVANGQTAITNAVNQGVTIINYRGGLATWGGWDYPSFYNADIQGLANGWKLPVITSLVCLTGNYNAEPCFGESWLRAGNPVTPKGGVGFFGASPPTTHSRWNNCLDQGIYWGLTEENIYCFGPMTYRGKMELYLNFPLETSPESGSEFYFNAYNLLGDPSLEIWTDVPRPLLVSHPGTLPAGTNQLTVTVLDGSSQPVASALVCLYKRGETKIVGRTDAAGQATLSISASTPDTLFITVTKHNYRPYCGQAMIVSSAVYVGYLRHHIQDAAGNHNGEINPAETIQLPVTIKNYGTTTTADNVTVKISCADPGIIINDSIKNYGNIAPGDSAVAAPFGFQTTPGIPDQHSLIFNLAISAAQGNWTSLLKEIVRAPGFAYSGHTVLDGGNGEIEPGETADCTIRIKNTGGLAGTGLTAVLRSLNPGMTVIDSLGSYADIAPGDSAANETDRFRIQAAVEIAPGHEIDLMLLITGDDGFLDTVRFALRIGVVSSSSPTGPDEYGYYAYDNTDTSYPEAPSYSWLEIDPGFGGSGTELLLANDETRTIALPFTFRYYGANYQRLSVCANGFAAMDSTVIADMYNWHIPSAGGPPLLIAPFWDDLDPTATDSSRSIYFYQDAANHRFVIEWSRIQHIHDPTNPTPAELQTFQMILYDPGYYPTQTGDGEIVFQYYRINNDDTWHDYATVGIENYAHTSGIEYTFANMYPNSAAALENGRAVKFTTDQPDPYPGAEEIYPAGSAKISLVVKPNPIRHRAIIEINSDQQQRIMDPELKIYDINGRLIRSLTLFSDAGAMPSVLSWDGTDQNRHQVPAGVYFISFQNRRTCILRKIVITR